MAIPTLTASKGEVKVKRGGTTTTLKKGDAPFPLQICDEITVDDPTANEYVITGVTRPGEQNPDTIKGTFPLHYKENRGDSAAFEVLREILGGTAYALLYIDPIPLVILETPLVQANYKQAVYLVGFDPKTKTSRFTVLQGEVDTAPVSNPTKVTRVSAGSEATYKGSELKSISPVKGYPQSPANLFLADEINGALLSWSSVTADVSGNPIKVAHYNVYRSKTLCFANTSDNLIGSTRDTMFIDSNRPVELVFYRVAAVTALGDELREGPASNMARRVDVDQKFHALQTQLNTLVEALHSQFEFLDDQITGMLFGGTSELLIRPKPLFLGLLQDIKCGEKVNKNGKASGSGDSQNEDRAKEEARQNAEKAAYDQARDEALKIKCPKECPKRKTTIITKPPTDPVCTKTTSYNSKKGVYTKWICTSECEWELTVECVE